MVDYERALASVRQQRDDMAWGPNNTFVFPRRGGTGEIYRRMAAPLSPRIRLRAAVEEVDARRRMVTLSDGERLGYERLLSTMPLDGLVEALDDCPEAVRRAGGRLDHNGVYMVGVGYETPLRDEHSWMYFPQPGLPFYRVTNFAKYAAANVPAGDLSRYCSYMTEAAFSEHKPVSRPGLEEAVEAGLREAGVVPGRPPVASVHVERIDYAYPIPRWDETRLWRRSSGG